MIAFIAPYCGIPLWIDCLLSFSAASSICIVPYLSVLPVLSLLCWSQQTPYHQWKFLFLLFEAQIHTPFKFIFVSVGDKLNIFSLRCIETANEGITSKLRSHPRRLRIMTLKNLLLDKIDSLVIRNKLIELYHTMLCAAIPRESNNTNENKTLRILNQAYADLMIQRSTLKPLGTDKYAGQLHNHIFCVEHTGSFSVYTLEGCTKYISRWGFP